jgi:hypothetical protein
MRNDLFFLLQAATMISGMVITQAGSLIRIRRGFQVELRDQQQQPQLQAH